jgi:hypothetical protein
VNRASRASKAAIVESSISYSSQSYSEGRVDVDACKGGAGTIRVLGGSSKGLIEAETGIS